MAFFPNHVKSGVLVSRFDISTTKNIPNIDVIKKNPKFPKSLIYIFTGVFNCEKQKHNGAERKIIKLKSDISFTCGNDTVIDFVKLPKE